MIKVIHPDTHRLSERARVRPRLSAFTLVLMLALAWSRSASARPNQDPEGPMTREVKDKISPWVLDKLEKGDTTEMLVLLDQGADLSEADGLVERKEKGRFVYDTLRGRALASQQELVTRLRSRGLEVTQFWIVNAILVRGDLSLASEIGSLREVGRIIGNPLVRGLEDVLAEPSCDDGRGVTASSSGSDALMCKDLDRLERLAGPPGRTWMALPGLEPKGAGSGFTPESVVCGVNAVKAPDVWTQKGVHGEGIVVASMDTGVEWTHPAIQTKYRGWNGGTPDHRYSWHDSIDHTTVPLDDNNHGTHTTGTMVGDDGGSNQIGVAPGARWVACRNMDHGDGTPARYLECMQWGLAPYPEGSNPMTDGRPDLAPDITNNSWACPPDEGCDALTLQQAFETVRSAGQMTVAAVGNAGSSCSSATEPPGIYDAAFSVGATSCTGTLASFSSRGPVTIDGSNRLKPNIAAPGQNVRSSVRGGGYQDNWSGTSMASPHVAGSLALFWSAKPQFKRLIRISRCYMEQAAGAASCPASPAAQCASEVCGGIGQATRPNNLWGWGFVNALATIDLGTTAPDSDGDGIVDACDCAPNDGAAFDGPSEVTGDSFLNKQTYTWTSIAPLTGPAPVYDVARGDIPHLRSSRNFSGATCISSGQSTVNYTDQQTPAADVAFYYLVRARNSCGIGSYGKNSSGLTRSVTACP